MQNVSAEWKEIQNRNLANESAVELTFDIADPDALRDASAEDNGHIGIADTSLITNELERSTTPYATLETNLWLLDNSRKIVPTDDAEYSGYISSELSLADCRYVNDPAVSISFDDVHRKPVAAVSIIWSDTFGEYAQQFRITAFNGNSVTAEKTVIGNSSARSVTQMTIENYDRIEIRIIKWCLPFRRARIAGLHVGMYMLFDKNTLMAFSHSQIVDPVSASLPKSEIQFSIENGGGLYDPLNSDSMSKYLIERQEVIARYGMKLDDGNIEWIKCGTFYLSEWGADCNGMNADFTARDLLEFLNGTYYKGRYGTASLYSLAENVLLDADLPTNPDGSVKWHIDDSLKNMFTVAPLPVDTYANCLLLIANAARCVFYQDRNGILRIEPIGYDVSDFEINPFNSYSRSEIELSKPVKQVSVPFYQYMVNGEKQLASGTFTVNGTAEIWLIYSEPARYYSVTADITGGTLVSAAYYTNACKINVAADSEITVNITGLSLKKISGSTVVTNREEGETVTVTNALVTDINTARELGEWVLSFYKNRTTVKSSFRADIRLDALDIIRCENRYGTDNVRVSNVKFVYNGAFRGSTEGKVTI